MYEKAAATQPPAYFLILLSCNDSQRLYALQTFDLIDQSAEFTLHFICFNTQSYIGNTIDRNGLVDGQDICTFPCYAIEHRGKQARCMV